MLTRALTSDPNRTGDQDSISEALGFIESLFRQNFYGSVTIKFENGKVVLFRKEETFIPRHTQKERSNSNESRQS